MGGLLVAYLNLDKVIKIIRNEDEPKPVLIKAFKLSEVQADAILNMRLRNLRKLEEMEIKRENKDLREEKAAVEKLIRSEKEQWKTVAGQIKEVRDAFSKKTPLGKRRTDFAEAPQHDEAAIEEAMVVREPITVVVSEKGWIRALRGHQTDLSGVAFKIRRRAEVLVPGRDHVEGAAVRHQRPLLHDRCVEAARRARPWRAGAALHRHRAGRRPGRGDALRRRPQVPGRRARAAAASSSRRTTVSPTPARASRCSTSSRPTRRAAVAPVEGELAAAVGENRKLVIFPLDQVPEMARGRGVRLQRHKDGGLSDVTTFKAADGLRWVGEGGRTSNLSIKELAAWRGNRGDAGRVRPDRFLANLKFGRPPENGKASDGK